MFKYPTAQAISATLDSEVDNSILARSIRRLMTKQRGGVPVASRNFFREVRRTEAGLPGKTFQWDRLGQMLFNIASDPIDGLLIHAASFMQSDSGHRKQSKLLPV